MRISTSQMHQQSVSAMLQKQVEMAKTQQQLSSGRRILTPQDDPAGSIRVLDFGEVRATVNQYQRNADAAAGSLSIEESTLEGVTNVLQRARELALRGNNDTLNDQDRQSIVLDLRELRSQLIQLANTKDGSGDYLFAGYQVGARPFSQDASGAVTYNGDQGQRYVQIGADRQVPITDSGSALFREIRSGNGTFVASADAVNAGSGIIDPGNVIDPSAYVADTYTITFVTNASGDLAYQVVGAASGQVVPPLPDVIPDDAPAYQSGSAISFSGMETTITGAPLAGDTFTVSPSPNQDMFATLQNLSDAMETPTVTAAARASLHERVSRALVNIDQSLGKTLEVRSRVGARLNAIETQQAVNEAHLVDIEESLSSLNDLDYTEAISRLNQQQVALQAAQQAYVRVQGLSLFNYL